MASYRIALDLLVDAPDALRAAAGERMMAAPGMTVADVVETLGPPEDPDIAACLQTLLDPARWPGCRVNDVACEAVDGWPRDGSAPLHAPGVAANLRH